MTEERKKIVATPVPQVDRFEIVLKLMSEGMIPTVPTEQLTDAWLLYAQHQVIKQLVNERQKWVDKADKDAALIKQFYDACLKETIYVQRDVAGNIKLVKG